MKLLVAGSRSITSFDLSPYVPADVDLIITGGAKGVDTLAEVYARERGDPHTDRQALLREIRSRRSHSPRRGNGGHG